MTNADIRASIEMQIAAGHSKIKLPLDDIKRLLGDLEPEAKRWERAT